MDPHNTIKQALAIAIVRQKRKTNKDADEWRIKAAWLEQQLVQEQDNHLALKQWTCSVLQQTSAAPAAEPMTSKAQNHMPDSIVLPPLVLGPSYSRDASSSHGTAYASLQHQLLLAAKTCAYADYAAVAEVLDGKAAALSDMLLTNLQMLQSLASQHTAAPRQRQGGNSLITPSPAVATGRLLATTRFVQETLLHVPSSSLRSAYMRQCAALVAALLSGTSTAASIHQQRQTAAKEKYPAAATSPVQDLDAGATAGQPEALAVETVQFMQQLLRHKMRAGSSPSVTSAPNTEQQQIDAVSAAATAMLQQLSTFPCTALLMSLSLAQQLQQYVQQLQQAKAAQASAQLGNLSSDVLQMASTAVEVTAQVFEASHELLAELVSKCKHICALWATGSCHY